MFVALYWLKACIASALFIFTDRTNSESSESPGTSLNQQDLVVSILCQTVGQDASCRTTANDDIVVLGALELAGCIVRVLEESGAGRRGSEREQRECCRDRVGEHGETRTNRLKTSEIAPAIQERVGSRACGLRENIFMTTSGFYSAPLVHPINVEYGEHNNRSVLL